MKGPIVKVFHFDFVFFVSVEVTKDFVKEVRSSLIKFSLMFFSILADQQENQLLQTVYGTLIKNMLLFRR